MTTLEKAYSQLPANKQVPARKAIMAACGFSKATFYYKLKGGMVKKPEQKVFAKYLDVPAEQLFKTITASPRVKKSILNEQ